jgi:hypothetical protein
MDNTSVFPQAFSSALSSTVFSFWLLDMVSTVSHFHSAAIPAKPQCNSFYSFTSAVIYKLLSLLWHSPK